MKEFNDILHCIWIKEHCYMLKQNNIIEIYDNDLNYVKKLSVDTDYSTFTYNDVENYFYFSLANKNNTLFKSNDLNSFEQVKLTIPNFTSDEIKHISYCKCYNSILITTTRNIFIFDLSKKHLKPLYEVKEKITKVNDCQGPLGCDLNTQITLVGTICCCQDIYVAYRQGQKSFISKLVNKQLEESVYETYGFIQSIFIMNNEVWILITRKSNQQLIYTGIDCNCCCSGNCKGQIIESIAQIENSIAKILNSESLKIKAAINKSEDIQDLICINSSVGEIIYYVTILEFVLSEKLKIINKPKKDDC